MQELCEVVEIFYPCPCGKKRYRRRVTYFQPSGADSGEYEEIEMQCESCKESYRLYQDFGTEHWVKNEELISFKTLWHDYWSRLREVERLASQRYWDKFVGYFNGLSREDAWIALRKCTKTRIGSSKFIRATQDEILTVLKAEFAERNFPTIFRFIGVCDQELDLLIVEMKKALKEANNARKQMKKNSFISNVVIEERREKKLIEVGN